MNRESRSIFETFFIEESGQDLIEYALVAALIAVGAIASMKSLAATITAVFTSIGSNLSSAA